MIEPRCFDHKNREVAPRLCAVCQRIAVEQEIVVKVIDALLAAGYLLQTDVADDPRPAAPTTDRAAILQEVMEVDDEFLGVWRGEPPADDPRPNAWVRFVYGNSGWDVVSDYTTSLEQHLKPVLEYADTLA